MTIRTLSLQSATSSWVYLFLPSIQLFPPPRQPDSVPPIHVLAPFDFCFINTPLRQPLIPSCLSVVFLDFLYASHLSSVPSHSNSFSVKPVLCPFHCSLSALWFPAVSSRHQLTFSSVFGMTTNSGSRQPVSASSPKNLYSLPTCRLML